MLIGHGTPWIGYERNDAGTTSPQAALPASLFEVIDVAIVYWIS